MNNDGPSPLENPFQVGNYLVHALIGAGAMGVVYLGTHRLDHLAALKRPFLDGTDPAARERFVEEAQRQARMQHPNIGFLYEFFEHEGQPWIAMEYFNLGAVRPLINRLTDREAVVLLADMLRGTEHAHGKRVVHRDLKPENVMRTGDGHIKIVDFGIAKAFGDAAGPHRTRAGWFHGDPIYVAPEVVLGEEAGPAADLYSIGVMAFEFLVGYSPFSDLPPEKVPFQKVSNPAPSLADKRADIDPALARWVDQLLLREPARRPETATIALTGLEEIAEAVWGPGWSKTRLPIEVAEANIIEHTAPPSHQLVALSRVISYASAGALLKNAASSRQALVALLTAVVAAGLLAKVFDELRMPPVIFGVIAVYLGVVSSLFFDERVAFDVGLRSPKAEVPPPKHSAA